MTNTKSASFRTRFIYIKNRRDNVEESQASKMMIQLKENVFTRMTLDAEQLVTLR